MAAGTAEGAPLADWRKVHAFGLPEGSVRALMALLIFGALWGHLLLRPDREVPESLKDVLFIILGHYFAVRARGEPKTTSGPAPLYLPRGAVRFLLIGGFVAVAAVLFRRGRLEVRHNEGIVTLLLVFGFLLGVVLQKIWKSLMGAERHPPRVLEDLRAGVALLAAVLLAVFVWDHALGFLPESARALAEHLRPGLGHFGLEHVLAAVVGFYFGSRS